MNVISFSDNHGLLPEIEECDLLLIAGDICPTKNHSRNYQKEWINSLFIPWVKNLKCDQVVLVPGNHDFIFEGTTNSKIRDLIELPTNNKLKVLINQEFTYYGHDAKKVTIFGTPYCKIFGNYAFMRDDDKLEQYYSEIPENIDILVCHDAPDINDQGIIIKGFNKGKNAGNVQLAKTVIEKKPKMVFHGHIHNADHTPLFYNNIFIKNVSILDDSLKVADKPYLIKI